MSPIFLSILHHGYAGLFSLLLLGILGVPISDEPVLAFAGYLVHNGDLSLLPAIAAAFAGAACSVTLSYLIGRSGGAYLVKRFGHFFRVTQYNRNRAQGWFNKAGRWAVFISYFLPVVRHLTPLFAGTSRMNSGKFAVPAYAGAFAFCATFILIGYSLGEECKPVTHAIRHHLLLVAIAVAALFIVYLMFSRARRQLG